MADQPIDDATETPTPEEEAEKVEQELGLAEGEPAVEAAPADTASAVATPDVWALVEEAFGTEEPEGVAETAAKLTVDDLKKIDDPTIRVLLRAGLQRIPAIKSAAEAAAVARQATLDAKEAELRTETARLAEQRRQFAKLATSPEADKLLAEAEGADTPDLTTPEGVRAAMRREAASHLREILAPIREDAVRRANESAYLEFLDQNAWAKDKAIQDRAVALIKERKGAGEALKTADALRLAFAEKQVAEQTQQRANELKERSATAATVQRRTAPSGRTGGPIPEHILAAARSGRPHELYEFFKANPAAKAAFDASL